MINVKHVLNNFLIIIRTLRPMMDGCLACTHKVATLQGKKTLSLTSEFQYNDVVKWGRAKFYRNIVSHPCDKNGVLTYFGTEKCLSNVLKKICCLFIESSNTSSIPCV